MVCFARPWCWTVINMSLDGSIIPGRPKRFGMETWPLAGRKAHDILRLLLLQWARESCLPYKVKKKKRKRRKKVAD